MNYHWLGFIPILLIVLGCHIWSFKVYREEGFPPNLAQTGVVLFWIAVTIYGFAWALEGLIK